MIYVICAIQAFAAPVALTFLLLDLRRHVLSRVSTSGPSPSSLIRTSAGKVLFFVSFVVILPLLKIDIPIRLVIGSRSFEKVLAVFLIPSLVSSQHILTVLLVIATLVRL